MFILLVFLWKGSGISGVFYYCCCMFELHHMIIYGIVRVGFWWERRRRREEVSGWQGLILLMWEEIPP